MLERHSVGSVGQSSRGGMSGLQSGGEREGTSSCCPSSLLLTHVMDRKRNLENPHGIPGTRLACCFQEGWNRPLVPWGGPGPVGPPR